MSIYGPLLREVLETGQVYDATGSQRPLQAGIASEAIAKLQELVRENPVENTLEIGMAMGMSALALLYALEEKGEGRHVAIDPYQRKTVDYFDPSKPAPTDDGWGGIGLAMVERAGLGDRFEHIDEPNYLALPRLVREGRKFDLIFIDGYHTFDYAFVDYFYSDLLLNEGGILIFDDVYLPMVHKVCRFLETHKAYELIGPEMTHPLKLSFRAKMAIEKALGRRAPRSGHAEYGSVIAYRKRRDTMVRPLYFHTDFYPHFKSWWVVKRMRGILRGQFDTPKPPPFDLPS